MAKVKDIRVSFIGKDEDGKYKRVDFHVHNVEKSLAAIAEDKELSGVSANIESLASIGESGSKTYPFKAAAEAE